MKRLFLGLIIAAAGASAAGCRDQNAAAATPPTPPTVSVVTVAPERVAIAGEWIATLDGNVNAQIRPQVTGYLTRRAYREGAFVRKGELLFEIDRRPLEAALSQARARLAEARAQLAKSERDLERDRPLAEQRAIAQSQLDNDLSARDTAQAAQASAEAAVESAELNLRFTRDHLADRRHRRHRQRPDRRSGRPDDAAHDRVAGGPDQGLLPDQRAGVPRHRRRRPLARRARPALAGRRAAWRWCSPTAARIRGAAPSSPSIARSTRRWARSASAPRSRTPATCCGPASSAASGRRPASRSRRCWCRSARCPSCRTAIRSASSRPTTTVDVRAVKMGRRVGSALDRRRRGCRPATAWSSTAPALRSGTKVVARAAAIEPDAASKAP